MRAPILRRLEEQRAAEDSSYRETLGIKRWGKWINGRDGRIEMIGITVKEIKRRLNEEIIN